MKRIAAKSPRAAQAYTLVTDLQQRFVTKLNAISKKYGNGKPYEPTEPRTCFSDMGSSSEGERGRNET